MQGNRSLFVVVSLYAALLLMGAAALSSWLQPGAAWPTPLRLNNYSFISGCVEEPGVYTQPQQYQYEGNPCHILYSNASIAAMDLSLDGGVDAATAIYDNTLLVPMSQPLFWGGVPSYTPTTNWSKVWGKLAAYNATTGAKLWEDNFTAPVMSQPFVVNGTVYIGTGGDFVNYGHKLNGIYALNLTTGKELWNVSTEPEHMPTPVYYNHTLIIVPGEGTAMDSQYLMALNATTGSVVWTLFIGGESAMSSPALVGNTIYFGVRLNQTAPGVELPGQNATAYAVNLDSRKVVWRDLFNGTLGAQDSPPAVYKGIVVIGRVRYLSSTRNFSGAVGSSPLASAVANSSMAQAGRLDFDAAYLEGLDAATGRQLWRFYEGSGVNPPRSRIPAPTVYNGVVYADSTVVGKLYAINVATGREIWSYDTGISDPNPAVVDGHVLAINQFGTLFVLNATTGALQRKLDLNLEMGWCGSGQLAIVGDKLVVGGQNNKLAIMPLSSIMGE